LQHYIYGKSVGNVVSDSSTGSISKRGHSGATLSDVEMKCLYTISDLGGPYWTLFTNSFAFLGGRISCRVSSGYRRATLLTPRFACCSSLVAHHKFSAALFVRSPSK